MTTPPTSVDNTAAALTPGQRGPRKPVTTLVSMLPKTTYNEADEVEGTVRTSPYVRVQHQLLHYLGIHASDTLTPRQALRWTEDTAENKWPQTKDALRLCYYMRCQGFDTYAAFRNGFMSLYIANQNTDVKGPGPDLLYWKQNFKNNAIAHEVTTQSESNGARGPRRNAFAPTDATTQELLAHLSAMSTASNRAQFANNLAVAEQDGHGGDAEGNVGPVLENNEGQADGDGRPAQGSLAARIAAATADLEILLLSNSPDTA